MRISTLGVVFVSVLLAVPFAACKSKSRSISGELRTRSDNLTAEAVAEVLSGSQDFSTMQGKLAEAVAIDRDNPNARLWLGVVTVLVQMQTDLQPTGRLNQLLERAGLVNPNVGGSLWDFSLQFENHGQGLFKDTTPTLGELQDYVHGTVRPALDALLTVLDSIPADWEYVIPASSGGLLLQELAPGKQIALRLDYGDVQLASAIGHGAQAVFDMLRAIDWNNLSLNDLDTNDDPAIDPLEVIRTAYPNLGRLVNPGDLLQARDRLRTCLQNYERASLRIRNENAQQQAEGIVTLGRDSFGDAQELQQFLATEARMRVLAAQIVDASYQNVVVRFDTDPFTGNALPLSDQAEINFQRFFLGLDIRDVYFQTVVQPFDGKRTLGVGAWSQLTATMATFGDMIVSIGGATPQPGDLQQLLYAVRVDSPPMSTKVVDGSFADWQTNAVQVSDTPAAWIDHPAPDLGAMYLAIDANALYVRLDQDLTPSLTAAGDRYEVTFAGPSGSSSILFQSGIGHTPTGPAGLMPTFAHNAQGIEMRFPLGSGTGQWAELRRSFHADNGSYVADATTQPIFVKVR